MRESEERRDKEMGEIGEANGIGKVGETGGGRDQ